MKHTNASLVGTRIQTRADVDAFDCQSKTQATISAGCVLSIECFEPNDPAAHQHGDGYLVWLETNECNDPQEDMQPDRWYIADAEQLAGALA